MDQMDAHEDGTVGFSLAEFGAAGEEAVVILKSNPIDLPMVCGLCGDQYATTRELENHMNIHRASGTAIKRGRGRPKGSKSKRVVLIQGDQISDETAESQSRSGEPATSVALDSSETRRSHRVVKKPRTDLYVQGDEELDALLSENEELAAYSKEALPQFNTEGVPIARVEDYITAAHNTDDVIIRVAGEETRGQLHISDISQGTSLNVPQSINDQTTEEVTEATEQVEKSTGIPQTVEVVVSTAHGTHSVALPIRDGSEAEFNRVIQQLASVSSRATVSGVTTSTSTTAASSSAASVESAVSTAGTVTASPSLTALTTSDGQAVNTLTTGQGGTTLLLAEADGSESTAGLEDEGITHIEVCLFDPEQNDGEIDAEGKTIICELCHVMLPAAEMRDHMVSLHMNNVTQEFVCPKPQCGLAFATIPKLRLHLVQEHQSTIGSDKTHRQSIPRVYACTDCDTLCATSELLKDHLLTQHNKSMMLAPRPTLPVKCPVCAQVCKSKNALKTHMSTEHEDTEDTSCRICHKVFKSKRAQSSHMKAHTKNYEPVNCEKCGKEFKHPSALKFHTSMMPECDKPKYVCDICGYKANTPWRLNSHKVQVHSNERPYQCEICQKRYKTNEMLKQHTYKLHTGTPRYECEICQRKFFYAAELREHKQLHSTTKEFVCPICNRAFKTMHVFRGHMNGKHSDTWYSCGFCKFTTSHKKSMKRHMILVHKLKNVTLEVTPEDGTGGHVGGSGGGVIPQQVEIIQSDDLTGLQLSEGGQVIDAMHHVQYDDVSGVISSHEQMDESSGHQQITEVITHQMDEESIRQLISQHQQAGSMNASEVSRVLVSLSGAVVTEQDGHVISTESHADAASHDIIATEDDVITTDSCVETTPGGTDITTVVVTS